MKEKIKKFSTLVFSVIMITLSTIFITGCGVKEITLDAPSYIKYDNGFISWEPIAEAKRYEIFVNGEKKTTSEAKIAYNAEGSNFNVKVKAFPDVEKDEFVDGKTKYKPSKDSNIQQFVFLKQITGLIVEDGILTWDPVENADGYRLKINGVEQLDTVLTNAYDGLYGGTSFSIFVKPIKNDNKNISYFADYSNEVVVTLLEQPSIEFENSTKTIFWNSIQGAAGYKVLLCKDGKELDAKVLGQNERKYVYNYPEVGKYSISVKATISGNETIKSSKYSTPLVIERLGVTSFVRTEGVNGNTTNILFEPVENAIGYDIIKNKEVIGHTSRNSYEYIEESINEDEEAFVLGIKAIGDGNCILDALEYFKIDAVKLATPKNIKVQNNTISWDAVDKTLEYELYIDGEKFIVTSLNYEIITITEGAHEFRVRARGNGSNYFNSVCSTSYQIIKLTKPNDLRITQGIFTWSPVAGAKGYIVKVGAKQINCDNNSCVIDSNDIGVNTVIMVKALGNQKNIFDSEFSDTYKTFKLDTPVLSINNDVIRWNKIDNAIKYELTINSSDIIVSGNSYQWAKVKAGEKRIFVKAIGDNAKYFNSMKSAEVDIRKLDAPVLTIEKDHFAWEHVIGAEKYWTNVNNRHSEIHNKDDRTLYCKFTIAQNNLIEARAIGDGKSTVSSDIVNIDHETISLSKPVGENLITMEKTTDGFVITLNKPIENAVEYKLEYGGNENNPVSKETMKYKIKVLEPGVYNFRYKAVADGFKYVDSDYSKTYTISVLNTVNVESIKLEKQDVDYYLLTWNAVNSVAKYNIEVTKFDNVGNVISNNSFETEHCSLDIVTTGVTYIEVKISCKGNPGDINVIESDFVTKILQCLGD